MGEVYRARDGRLDRDVALKVLPSALTVDADRLLRFKREALVLASLNHPNIAAIYGLEEGRPSGSELPIEALVLELVEGPTLAERIAQGPLPIDEARAIGMQIAGALEAAHERGIVHRDLKPANVKVRPDGTVKVLDFGLAKAWEPPSSEQVDALRPRRPSPVRSMGAAAGIILGTAAYMSPEQARGAPVDKRTDVWAFGCVLFEMLAGRHVFGGAGTVSDAIAAVLKSEPDWQALPANTPPHIRALLKRCLEKDPRRRLRDIGDAGLLLGDSVDVSETTTGPSRVAPNQQLPHRGGPRGQQSLAGASQRSWRSSMPPGSTGGFSLQSTVVCCAAAAGAADGVTADAGNACCDASPSLATARALSTSVATAPGRRLYLQDLASGELKRLPETAGADAPAFSPDGRAVGFCRERQSGSRNQGPAS